MREYLNTEPEIELFVDEVSTDVMFKPSKVMINLEKYFRPGMEIEVDRYGVYRVDKLEKGVLHLSSVLLKSYKDSPQYNFVDSMFKEAIKDLLEGDCDGS